MYIWVKVLFRGWVCLFNDWLAGWDTFDFFHAKLTACDKCMFKAGMKRAYE